MLEKKSAQVGVKLPPSMKQRVESQAQKQDRSVNWLINRYIALGLKRDEKPRRKKS